MKPIEKPKIEQLVSNILALLSNGTYTVYDAIKLCFERMRAVITWLNTNGAILADNETERIEAENGRQEAEAQRVEHEQEREEWFDDAKVNTQKKLKIVDGQLVVEVGDSRYALMDARRIFEGNIDIIAGVDGFDQFQSVKNMPAKFELNGFGKAKFCYRADLMGELDSIKANGIEVLQNFVHTVEEGSHVYVAKEDGNHTGIKYILDKINY